MHIVTCKGLELFSLYYFPRSYVKLTIAACDYTSEYSNDSHVSPIDPLVWLRHNAIAQQDNQLIRRQPVRSCTASSLVSSSLSSSMPSTAGKYYSLCHTNNSYC